MIDNGSFTTKLTLLVVAGSILVLLGLVITESLRAGMDAQEAALNPKGYVHELYRDPQGKLWISDYLAGEIWRVDPDTNAYTVYENLLGASDGRIDSGGELWWTGVEGGALGRYRPGAASATVWSLGATAGPLGIDFDNNGKVWVTDVIDPSLYSFNPADGQLCTYLMPNDSNADYVLHHNGYLWMGDTTLGRIIRFTISNANFQIWQLPDLAYPLGLAMDSSGGLWYADAGLGELGIVTSADNKLRRYAIPALSGPPAEPVEVAFNDGKVWFTNLTGSVGRLDPAGASSSTSTVAPSNVAGSPSCSPAGAGTAVTVSSRTGTLEWTAATYPLVHDQDGWMIHGLPEGASPWGLAVNGSSVWFNDQGTIEIRPQLLGWMQFGEEPSDYWLVMPVVISSE